MNNIPDLPMMSWWELVLPECKGRGSGGEQNKQVVSVPVHSIGLVALQRRAGTLYYWSVYIAMYNTHSTCSLLYFSCTTKLFHYPRLASFPGPAQLSVAITTASNEKLDGAWERG